MDENFENDILNKEEKEEPTIEENDTNIDGENDPNEKEEESEENNENENLESQVKAENNNEEQFFVERNAEEEQLEIPQQAEVTSVIEEEKTLNNEEEEESLNGSDDSEYSNEESTSENEFQPQNKIAEYDESDDSDDDRENDEEEERLESYLPRKPNFLNENLKLEDFTPIVLNPRSFPTNRFMAKFFSTLWSNINGIPKFYDPGATFSLTVDYLPSSKMALYSEFASNFITSERAAPVGGIDIMKFQEHIFPRGFIAYPTMFQNRELADGLYAVVVHGAFQGVESLVFGFDRTLVIAKYPYEYRITNDTLHIRRANL